MLGNPIFLRFSGGSGPPPPPPLWIGPWHASERRYLSEMFCDHRTQSRTLGRLVCPWSDTPDDLLDPNCLQTWIAGRKSRERETARVRERERDCTVFAHKSFVLAWFLRISKHNVWVSQSILLQLLPMRTQNPKLSCASAFVR